MYIAFVPRLSPPTARRSHAQRSAHTRAQVLSAAAGVVQQRGAQAASMFEVAKAAGVTPGALQHHFGSKAELMLQLVEHLLAADDGSGVAWPSPTLPLSRRAPAFVQALWDTVYASPRFLAAWAVYFGSSGDAALLQRLAERRRDVNAGLRQRLRAVFPELQGPRTVADVCDLVLATLRGLALLRLFDPDARPSAGARRELARWIEVRCASTPVPSAKKATRP